MDAEGEFEVDVLLAEPVLLRPRRGKGVGTGETIETRMMSGVWRTAAPPRLAGHTCGSSRI